MRDAVPTRLLLVGGASLGVRHDLGRGGGVGDVSDVPIDGDTTTLEVGGVGAVPDPRDVADAGHTKSDGQPDVTGERPRPRRPIEGTAVATTVVDLADAF